MALAKMVLSKTFHVNTLSRSMPIRYTILVVLCEVSTGRGEVRWAPSPQTASERTTPLIMRTRNWKPCFHDARGDFGRRCLIPNLDYYVYVSSRGSLTQDLNRGMCVFFIVVHVPSMRKCMDAKVYVYVYVLLRI